MSGSITQLCRLPLPKCISVGLFIPVIFLSYTTILFLFIFPALSHKLNQLHLNFLLSHLSFFFLYLSHPTLDLVSLPSFPVHCFCLPCFEQTTVHSQRLRSSTFISLSDDEIVPRVGDHSWQIISKSRTESVSHTRKGALGWPTWFLSSDAAD